MDTNIISKKSFLNCFSKSVYKKIIKESTLAYSMKMSYTNYLLEVEKLYDAIQNNNYSPLSPIAYVYIPKTLYVARTIPILHFIDESFYYFMCKYIEDDIAENRVKNTFGGWRLGNALRTKEEDDIDEIQYVYNSYNPALWSKAWKEFINIARSLSNSGLYKNVIKLDISNFYDSVNLNILSNKLTTKVHKDKLWCVRYIMYFLKYWNKRVDDYQPRSAGLPQTEFGDQSRLLANFYLQEYDMAVKQICDVYNAEYIRYADDQLIFLKDDNFQKIILTVNRELNKIGLNLNSAKCKKLSVHELSNYYLFEPQSLLDLGQYDKSFDLFYSIYSKDNSVRYDTYIRRILNAKIGLNAFNISNQSKAKRIIFSKEFLIFCSTRHLENIYNNLNSYERSIYIRFLLSLANETSFNAYHYNVYNFLKSIKWRTSVTK